MKAFVIGGAGFIGSYIVEELIQQKIEVVVIDNLSNGNIERIPQNISFYNVDILDDDLDMIFENEKPNYIFHLAAQTSVQKSMAKPLEDTEINVLGTVRLLQCAIKHKVDRFIFASTAAVYGVPDHLPIEETAHIKPISFYGSSKAVAENYIQLFHALHDLPYSILRYANVYGPRQSVDGEAGVITIFFKKALNNELITIFGSGEQTRDFVYVKDVAKATVQTIFTENSHIMNISSQTAVSINQLINHLNTIFPKPLEKSFIPKVEGDIEHSFLNYSKAKNTLHWQPTYTIDHGLTEMYELMYEEQKKKDEVM